MRGWAMLDARTRDRLCPMQIQELASAMEADPGLKAKMVENPVGTLGTLSAMPLQTDVWIYRYVVLALGSIALIAILGGLTLAFFGKTSPEGVIALGSTALGAIAGLLAPSPGRR